GDALYAAESIMELCSKKYNWKYLFIQKSNRQKLLHESYEWLKNGGGTEQIQGLCKEKGTGCYANHVEEVAGKEEVMNVFEYEYEGRNKEGKSQTNRFCWVTDIELTKRNLEEMILAGRGRWKIENEGFNNQKNGIYRIEHLNSRNSNAMKNHYLLTQIADILMQLYLAWNPYIKELKQTIKNTSSGLLESFRGLKVTKEDVSYIFRHTSVYLE
ncbi:MAG: transposase, partial [Lachnospiraceae bacterium]|nr:transposase [Lachnospiraceae bacterium]